MTDWLLTEQASVSVRCNNNNNNAMFGQTSSLNVTRPITMTDCGNNQSIYEYCKNNDITRYKSSRDSLQPSARL